MDPQRPVVDDRVGPGTGDQLLVGDRLAGAFDKREENVQGSAAEAQRLPVVEQHPLRGDQPERSEDEGFIIHGGTVLPARGFI